MAVEPETQLAEIVKVEVNGFSPEKAPLAATVAVESHSDGANGTNNPAEGKVKLESAIQLTAKDAAQLQIKDVDFKLMTWADVGTIIEENRHEDLQRVPSDLLRYIAWSTKTKAEYGTIMAFLLQERLGWSDIAPKSMVLFECYEDVKILINDWPYGLEKDILHMVVWTKSPIPTEPPIEDMTPEARAVIHNFVMTVFGEKVGEENVLWFKNWKALQSVQAVEHVHVLVRGANERLVKEWLTGPWGDKTLGITNGNGSDTWEDNQQN